ncbi:nuclear factor interleukin-3-regulated protein-like [Cyclopterus lumpus]|uniref:BZIP domain-containing protein n=1 Tax=Cyclopterus lumpus TaxID=8103 RepID=A0A8C3AP70_CYCLU|nr:nuclear factor interleukin-3-regulated protein-like [Cyclopterus lumpus]XP_034396210.1 nuclear factor interleukin-3-regulated protein-like [Cyclopterus lumpus]XP_034396211.1 nuclear factor interleukin-3-regulated protein-like [Cyclopterus lumpus]XP_034396213.1 nuclear factor interleukin-3-regulated protein-like [Cyclopterus lumpus]XP_034396214.1 nuclear factor interleukin-3-regulated protein-like [Cyclopterus lumpus]
MENLTSALKTLDKNSADNNCSETFSSYEESLPSAEGSPNRLGRPAKGKPSMSCRRKREFISDEKKDACYWEKRRKNNEAAKRSREKRRLNDMVLENRVMALNDENVRLKTELLQLKLRFGLISTASYIEKSQQMGASSNAGNGGSSSSSSSTQYYSSGYSSGSQVMMNSDSSETEQSGHSEGHRQMVKYSPRGSLSDMSDGSSRDSPEPLPFEIKQEGDQLEMDIASGTTTQIMFNIHRGLPAVPTHHQIQQHSQELEAAYHSQQQQQQHHQQQQQPHQEPVTANNAVSQPAPNPPAAQRSVILYGSSSASYPVDALTRHQDINVPAAQKQSGGSGQTCVSRLPPSITKSSTETLAEVTKQLERKTLDSPPYELSDSHNEAGERQGYIVGQPPQQHLEQEQDQQERDPCAEILHQQVEGVNHSYLYHPHQQPHHSYLCAQDEEPPVLTYEGGHGSEADYRGQSNPSSKDTSSSDGDHRSSDKDASTDDDESPSSSCSDLGSYHSQHVTSLHHPASPLPSSQGCSQAQGRDPQGEVKGTALPHKLRLKHRAMSSGQESPMTPPSATPPPLPQHPYLSLMPQQNVMRESPTGGFKLAASGEGGRTESGKKETGGRRNKRRD